MLTCCATVLGSGYSSSQLFQLSRAAESLVVDEYGDLVLARLSQEQFNLNPLPSESVASLSLRWSIFLERLHVDIFNVAGVPFVLPVNILLEFR